MRTHRDGFTPHPWSDADEDGSAFSPTNKHINNIGHACLRKNKFKPQRYNEKYTNTQVHTHTHTGSFAHPSVFHTNILEAARPETMSLFSIQLWIFMHACVCVCVCVCVFPYMHMFTLLHLKEVFRIRQASATAGTLRCREKRGTAGRERKEGGGDCAGDVDALKKGESCIEVFFVSRSPASLTVVSFYHRINHAALGLSHLNLSFCLFTSIFSIHPSLPAPLYFS